jgi:transcriptional regulator with XRE-family HTH domain
MKTQHDVLMEDPAFRKQLAVETLVTEAAEIVAHMMAEQGLSKADLARQLNKSRSWVTQLLSGETNMTVRTLAEVVFALGGKVELQGQRTSSRARRKKGGSVVFEMDNKRLSGPKLRDDLFELGDVSVELDPESPEYAA